MSDWFYNTLNRLTFWLTLGALFALAILSANIEIKDLDLWLHLRSGQFIVDHHQVPNVDIFSFSIAGKPWINHEWLFQVFVFSIYNLFDFDGLIQMQAVVVALTLFLLVLFTSDNKHNWLASLGLFFVIMVYQTRFTIRPDLFSLLFLIIYLHIIFSHLDKKESYLTIFLVQLLWTNMHGFFMLGPVLLLLCFVAESIKRSTALPWEWKKVDTFPDKEYWTLLKLFIMSLLVCFINPYGIDGVIYPIKVLLSIGGESKVFFKHIIELQSPVNFQNLFAVNEYVEYKWLILLSGLSFLWNYRKINITLFIIWLVFLVFSLKAVRNIPFFAFISFATLIYNGLKTDFGALLPTSLRTLKYRTFLNLFVQAVVIMWTLNYIDRISTNGYFDFENMQRKSEFGGVSLRNFPHKGADFLVQNDIKGRFFNDFNSGSYLIGRTSPNIKVFMDGRTEMYGATFFEEYRKAFEGDKDVLKKVIETYDPTGAFLNAVQSPPPEEILQFFYNSKDWSLVYFDYDAIIFLKNIPENQKWIDENVLDLDKWRVEPLNLLSLGAMDVTAFWNAHRATNFYSMGRLELAKEEALEALRIDPRSHTAYKILGLYYLHQDSLNLAFENLRKAKILNPGDAEIRFSLGICLYRMGELNKAEEQMQAALMRNTRNSKAMAYLALIKAKEHKFPEALDMVEHLDRMPPKTVYACLELAEILKKNEKWEEAKKVYQKILKINPDNQETKDKLEALNGR